MTNETKQAINAQAKEHRKALISKQWDYFVASITAHEL
jgi:hypothetical protein